MNPNVKIFTDTIDLVKTLSNELKEIINGNPKVNIALSGGSTPSALFTYLAHSHAADIQWRNANFYWVDERCVPHDHVDSNYGKAMTEFFLKINFPKSQLHPVDGTNHPTDEAERYSGIIESNLGKEPLFDLILLGMGDDGHTASIFPNNIELLNSEFSVVQAIHPISGQKRITLTGKTICNAEQIVFLICGKSKASILKQIINNELNSQQFPAAIFRNSQGIVDFFIDKEAGSLL